MQRDTNGLADPRDVIRRRQHARLTFARYAWQDEATSHPGELLSMGDDSEWFHPYSGGAPVRITEANRSGLMVNTL